MSNKIFFTNERHNKAALVLASMSPDMVDDIVNLVNSNGGGLSSTLFSANDGPPRPLAMFSNSYIGYQDFPTVWVGFLTMQLADLNTAGRDAEYYAGIIRKAFGIPDEQAAKLAERIESYDVIGATYSKKAEDIKWYNSIGDKLMEGIRRLSNIPANLFNTNGFLYNDQDQKYDIDYLFELHNLGNVVNELMVQSRLIKGQALINSNLGIMNLGDPEEYGDVEYQIADIVETAMGAPMPSLLLGGVKKLVESNKIGALKKLQNLLFKAGVLKNNDEVIRQEDPNLKNTVLDIAEGRPSPLAEFSQLPSRSEWKRRSKKNITSPQDDVNATFSMVAEDWGAPVAHAMLSGDPSNVIAAMMEMQNMQPITTGDPAADAATETDVDNAMRREYANNPRLAAADQQVGFLFFGNKKKKKLDKARKEYLMNLENDLRRQKEEAELRTRYMPSTNVLQSQAAVGQGYNVGQDPYAAAYGPGAMAQYASGLSQQPNSNPPWPPFNQPYPQPSTNYNSVPATAAMMMPSYGYNGLGGAYGQNMLDMFPSVYDQAVPGMFPML